MEESYLEESTNGKCKGEEAAYKKIKVLGEGAMGKAYLVESNENHNLYVMKRINIGHLEQKQKQNAMRQAQVHSIVSHPNIIAFKEIYHTTKDKLCIIMEYASGGDLDELIKQQEGKQLSEVIILKYFSQICLGLNVIHENKIIHRDIKGANIFLTQDGIVKIGDFGISKLSDQTLQASKTFVGTPYYLSPQMIEGKPYSTKADIWSLGVLLYHLCALKLPFDANSLPLLALKILKGSFPPITGPYSKDLKNLVLSLLQVSPTKRPTIKQILVKPFIAKHIPKQELESIQKILQQNKAKKKIAPPKSLGSTTGVITKKQQVKKKPTAALKETPQQLKARKQQMKLKREEMRRKMKQDIEQKRKEKNSEPKSESISPNRPKQKTSQTLKVQRQQKKIQKSPAKTIEKPWKVAKPAKTNKEIPVEIFVPPQSKTFKEEPKQEEIYIPPENDFKFEILAKPRPILEKSMNSHQEIEKKNSSQMIEEEIHREQIVQQKSQKSEMKFDTFQDMLEKVNNAQKAVECLPNKFQHHDIELYEESQTFDSAEQIKVNNPKEEQIDQQGKQAMKYLNNANKISENIQEIIQVLEQGLGVDNFIESYHILKQHLEQSEDNQDYTFDRQNIRHKMPFLSRDVFDAFIVLLYTLLFLEKMEMNKNFESEEEEEEENEDDDNQ